MDLVSVRDNSKRIATTNNFIISSADEKGKVKIKVKPETQNGTVIKLKGKGFPVYKKDGQFGDLYITYIIKIPTNLTERQKKLFAELSKT